MLKSISQAALVAAVLGPVLIAPSANANEWYGRVSVGQSEITGSSGGFSAELDEGLSYGAALGTSVGPFRVEAGVDQLSGDFAGIADVDALAYSATAYLDLNVGENASVFVGAGADYIDAELSVPGFSVSETGDGWHYDLGAAYRLSDRFIGEVRVRQIQADIAGIDVDTSQVTAGIRFAL